MPTHEQRQGRKRLADLGLDDRLARAKVRTDRLIGHITSLFLMHEANAIVIYSPALAEQIPRSYAAHAFNQFQRSMHLFELVRLTALWDPYGDNRESIPTIVNLIDHPEIIQSVVESSRAFYATHPEPHDLRPSSDPEVIAAKTAWWESYRLQLADEEAQRAANRLTFALKKTKGLERSVSLKALREFRHGAIAHNLEDPEPDLKTMTDVRRLRYGDEKKLLAETVAVADALHLTLNGSSFMWDDAREDARRNAEHLWNACRFD